MRAKTGGRTAGTPNKSTATVKAFFTDVLERAFTNPKFKTRLVTDIVSGAIDSKLLMHILDRVAGKTTTPVAHSGRLTLEQIVAGTVPDDDAEAGDE